MDYFEILEVDKSASQAEIKKSYRRLAAKYHPDKNTSEDAIERFQHIQESYSVLSEHRGLEPESVHCVLLEPMFKCLTV